MANNIDKIAFGISATKGDAQVSSPRNMFSTSHSEWNMISSTSVLWIACHLTESHIVGLRYGNHPGCTINQDSSRCHIVVNCGGSTHNPTTVEICCIPPLGNNFSLQLFLGPHSSWLASLQSCCSVLSVAMTYLIASPTDNCLPLPRQRLESDDNVDR